MEIICPEIALKQPKADPRTVLLHKRNFMESSSYHVQDLYGNSLKNITSIANCDKYQNTPCKYAKATTATNTTENFLKSSPALFYSSSLITSTTSSSLLTTLLSSNLVNFSKSCHFKNSFNKYLNKTHKTKSIFFLLFVWYAILLQTTQAVPVRRISTSGRKFILHTNVYREHYHQKLLEEQRQHKQHQLKLQQELREQQQRQLQIQQLQQLQQQQQQQHQLETQSQAYFPNQHLQKQQISQPQPLQQQHQYQVQKNHIFSPVHHSRKHPQQELNHRHHLNQRAAPVASSTVQNQQQQQQQFKMSNCNSNEIYSNLHQQMNASLMYIKQLCTHYLRDRNKETYEGMLETWKQISLQTRNPNQQPVAIDNELHREIYEFYLNLVSFDKLLEYAEEDTYKNKTQIEHAENISIDTIIKFFKSVRTQIRFNMMEADRLMEYLKIERPDLNDHQIDFDGPMGVRRVRDFLIIKNLIEEFERVLQLVQNYCEINSEE